MKASRSTRSLMLASSMAALSVAHPAWAQGASEAGEDASTIVVTARRIEERLQDVPISMTVFNQQQLTNRNIVSAGDIGKYTPSLASNGRYGGDNTSFAIRGFVQDLGTAPSVGVYFADVVALRAPGGTLGGNGAGPGAFFDLQNVQVLKGPQGTLFGRNTTGGAVLIVPQKPTSRFEGYVEGSVGNYDMRRIQAVVNVPVGDSFRVRLGVDRQTRDGFLKNQTNIGPKDFGDVDYWAFRASAVADLTPNLENYTVLTYSKSDTSGYHPQIFACNPLSSNAATVAGCAQVARLQAAGFYAVENNTVNPRVMAEQWQIINTTTWKASDSLTIKNIASYGEFRGIYRQPVYGENLILRQGDTSNPANVGKAMFRVVSTPFPGRYTQAQSTFTEELQFQGNVGDSLVWQAGGYMELSEPLGFSGALSPQGAVCPDDNPFNCVTSGVSGITPGTAGGRSNKQRFSNYGLYAQATYNLTDQLSVTGGIRYTWDLTSTFTRNINYFLGTAPITANPPLGACASNPAIRTRTEEQCEEYYRHQASRPTWLVGIDYKPIDDVLLYAKYARGYRAGGLKSDALAFATFEPEKVDAYEIGAKTSFSGAIRGTFNIAAFYNDFTDQQFSGSSLAKPANPNPTPAQVIVSAGKSRIWGVEVESSVTPFTGFTIDVGYAHLNTRLKALKTFPDVSTLYNPPTPSGALIGYPLALSPKNKFTITATYTLPLDESIGRISVGGTFVHTDSYQTTVQDSKIVLDQRAPGLFNVIGRDLGILPPTNLLNLNLNWNSIAGSPVDLALFMTNVTKRKYATAVFGGLPTFGWDGRSLGEPRMFGARLKYRFGN